MNVWSFPLPRMPSRAQGQPYHLPLPDCLFELTEMHNTLPPDIRRPSLSST
jgi:hypothetical protein